VPDMEWRDDQYVPPPINSDVSRHAYIPQAYAAPPRHHPYLPEPRPEPPRKSGRLGVKRRQKYTRSRTGCLGCEARPICRRCVVAKREVGIPSRLSR
jgi:hypothetical protein